jgi:SAM-dependent methyltransferase
MEPKDTLLEAAGSLCRDPAFRTAIARHCRPLGERVDESRLSTRIHANDQMLQHSLRHFGDVNQSLSQYFNVALQQHSAATQLLRLYFGTDRGDLDILDFACGYGRFLRLLVLGTAPERIWASEIQHDAVDYVVREFGVHGIYSDVDPQRFEPGRRFDFIWVASLFSHLPDPLFHAWLARLIGVLKPGGVLCFSVHDERLLPAGTAMSGDGIHYITDSENADLDKRAYGTTFVSEAYVRAAIERACGAGHPYHRVPRGLANEQDIYVVPRAVDRDLGRLAGFRLGPWGCVDLVRPNDSGGLYVCGWAASLDDAAIEGVDVTVDGTTQTCRTGLARDDVWQVLGDPRFATSGWEVTLPLVPGAASAFVEVGVRTNAGERALLYAGRVALPSSRAATDAGQPAVGGIAQRIGAFIDRLVR